MVIAEMNTSTSLTHALQIWLQETMPEIGFGAPAHIHADQLAKECDESNGDALSFMWRAFLCVIEILGDGTIEHAPSLVIDLVPSESLVTSVPDLNALQLELSREPPALYVTKRKYSGIALYEGYRVPIDTVPPFAAPSEGIHFVYRCARSNVARKAGWEFSRSVIAEFVPPALGLLQ